MKTKSSAIRLRRSKGVTIIMVAGVLAILAALGAAFYSVMYMQSKSAVRYSDSVRAEFLARAGINDAIARLRLQTYRKTEDPADAWYTVDYLQGGLRRSSFAANLATNGADDDQDGVIDNAEERRMPFSNALGQSVGRHSDRYSLIVTDAASKINVNSGDNLAVIMDNLCRLIGPPLVAADLDHLQPRRWMEEGADAGLYGKNSDDRVEIRDLYYAMGEDKRPKLHPNGSGRALYGDGYAIASYRSRHGNFKTLSDVKDALTYIRRPDAPHLEELEREVKFAAIKEYITLNSWVDTTTICAGKFEWTDPSYNLAIDRDKSWVEHDLAGCYVSLINGHGSGQLRRIKDNGIDWIEVEGGWVIQPGPVTSYIIVAKEDAKLEEVAPGVKLPVVNSDGALEDDPTIDYARKPLCIHRAPVNINTASDKVLAALFMGLNVQHGHPMAIGTDADLNRLYPSDPNLSAYDAGPPCKLKPAVAKDYWVVPDQVLKLESFLLTPRGLKRIPADSGKLTLNRPLPNLSPNFAYVTNYSNLGTGAFINGGGDVNEALELAYRVIVARQRSLDPATGLATTKDDPDSTTADPASGFAGFNRGPFSNWDDFYFRVVKPWDDVRSYALGEDVPYSGAPAKTGLGQQSVARMIMAHFNSNTDLLKFNPNIEWIDRWGRNFTELEPVMVFAEATQGPNWTSQQKVVAAPVGAKPGNYFVRSMRYKSDEMIDKSDMNRSTTEFAFDSGGIFEIESTGQVVRGGEVLAERRLQALVKVYDVWRESTQAQFVRGTISHAAARTHNTVNGATSSGFIDAGKVVRDAENIIAPKALDTWPEPLVPSNYRIVNPHNEDFVDSGARNAWGQSKSYETPDVLANHVLPASYDGQIALATNTARMQSDGPDKDDFLASFNGDLDTDTCRGNGREQAKTPKDAKLRVVDTFGLLGLLNDKEVDVDPDTRDVFVVTLASNTAMQPLKEAATDPVTAKLNPNAYWSNRSVRVGDLRPEGVFLGNVGASFKDATLKYPFDGLEARDSSNPKPGGVSRETKNYYPGSPEGTTISLWFKPAWQGTDNLEHEFFNASTAGDPNGSWSRFNYIYKSGRFSFSKRSTAGQSQFCDLTNCLHYGIEDSADRDIFAYLHGGTARVPANVFETPSYQIQSFRWNFVGAAHKFHATGTGQSGGTSGKQYGIWATGGATDPWPKSMATNVARPFIQTQRHPEGTTWDSKGYWFIKWQGQNLDQSDLTGQPAAYAWTDTKNPKRRQACFSVNNVNENPDLWIYRSSPIDGTQAVIDELKISRKWWDSNRIDAEQTLSRYYLPANPSHRDECPTFTSQSLLAGLRGVSASEEEVSVARVSWNVFTPRFMHENKRLSQFKRNEVIEGKVVRDVPFRGPFDYCQYNRDSGYDAMEGWKRPEINPIKPALGVDRLPPEPKTQSHFSKGVEVEMLDDYEPIQGWTNTGGTFEKTAVFINPNATNTFVDPLNPAKEAWVKTNRLRYRVRFRYPIDPRVDSSAEIVDPQRHFLLDTPVFDDISITYFTRPRILYFREVSE